jgi:protein disulfide-isomerase A6
MKLFSTCLLAGTTLLASMTQALYKFPGPVIELTTANFKKEVLDDDAMWLVEFYAPWCGHCKQLAPSWELAAKQLKGVVKLGAVDMTEHQSVG